LPSRTSFHKNKKVNFLQRFYNILHEKDRVLSIDDRDIGRVNRAIGEKQAAMRRFPVTTKKSNLIWY